MPDFEKTIRKAAELVKSYEDLRKDQVEMDRMANLEYRLPPSVEAMEWTRTVKVTAPYDFLQTATQVFATLKPNLKIDPISVLKGLPEGVSPDSQQAKDKANDWESALKWQMTRAADRTGTLYRDIVRSAFQYDEVAIEVVHIPTQIKALDQMKKDTTRQQAALDYGDFAVHARNVQNIYVRWSDYMSEAVLYLRSMKAQELVDNFGVQEIKALIDKKKAPEDWLLFDWVEYGNRLIFAIPGRDLKAAMGLTKDTEGLVSIQDEAWKYKFLPWATERGGTNLDPRPHRQRMPLLYGIYRAETWLTANILGSLGVSEVIAEAAAPDMVVTGPTPQSIDVEYWQPGGRIDATTGHTVQPFGQPPMNPAIREALDRFTSDMQTALPRILVTAEALPNEPGFGFNLRLRQALGKLSPWKILAERGLTSAYRLFLLWAKASNTPIDGYGPDGKLKRIEPKDIDPRRLYLDAFLKPDVPIERQQAMLTAIQAANALTVPPEWVLDQLDETEPEKVVWEYYKSQLTQTYLEAVKQRVVLMAAPPQPSQPEAGIPGLEGANPAAGTPPPNAMMPGATREMMTGQTRLGEPIE